MLSRAEETGGTRVIELARGTPGSPIPPRSSPHPPSRNTSDTNALSSSSRADSNGSRSRAESTPDGSGTNLFHSTALAELLQQDDRPVFVVDADDERHGNPERLRLVFANNALKRRHSLLDQIQGEAVDQSLLTEVSTPFIDFRAWVLASLDEAETIDTFSFAALLWKSASLRKRLKVVTGQTSPLPPLPHLIADPQSNTPFPNAVPLPMPLVSAAATSYFERNPPMTSGALHSVFDDGASPQSPMSNPTPSGGLGYSELLTTPMSPVKEQIRKTRIQQTYPVRTPSEGGEGADWKIVSDKGFFDWTRLPDLPNLPPHIQFTRSVDWAATSLGPVSGWESDLRGMCNLIMASPHPAAMYWGPEHVAIYNEPYILLAGQKHPALMGSRYCDAWAEIWDALKDVFDNAYNHAQATMKDDDCLCIMRNGFLEECYFSWSIIPLIGDDGSVVGLYNPAFEKTRRKIAERRMLTLREVGERTATARHVSQFWGLLIDGLSYNELDVPLAMVYSLGKDPSDNEAPLSGSSSGAASKVARLKATLGITVGHPAAPALIDLKTSTEGFASTFRQALTQDNPIVLRWDDGTLDTSLLHGIQWRGFGDPSRLVVVMPIHPTTGDSTLGFLVIGTNPRRPYDEDFELFVQLLARQLATSIASVVLFEEEIRKGERAAQLAAQDRIELSNQLVARTQEAVEAENKFTRMAELAPVGVFIGDASGQITFVNEAWLRLSSYPRGGPPHKPVDDDWLDYVLEEDQVKASAAWATMFANKVPVSVEFRFKTPWKDKMGNTGVTWVIASAHPEKDEDGNIQRIFGSVTNISDQKFAEILQTKRMEEAVELKRQQERYIDTTSHEMRNPLSAILQSADSITSSLTEMIDGNDLTDAQRDLLDVAIETAKIIDLCAQHQKRIVDDVLTLSKLDSAMMVVTPIDVQPVTVVERALKMFESEFQNADIALEFKLDESYTTLNIDWVRLDPHRLSQVLINLTTNAIKFTSSQERRTIHIYVGASAEKPSKGNKWGLTFIASQNRKDRDVTAAPEWGLGEMVYIYFAVQDTGRGLDDLEKKQLFQRFSQANPRTHIHYGGSGLGLFISRELVELQGGEIGVASEAGKGSTFSFYVKARRSSGPSATNEEGSFGGLKSRTGPKNRKLPKIKSQVFAGIPSAASSPSDSPKSLPVTWKLPSSQTPIHVLIVEDNLINQKVLATQLRKTGCTVYVANHGGEAIDIIRASDFYAHSLSPSHGLPQHQDAPAPPIPTAIDIVLMDLEMPVMDGVSCARKLREMQDTGELVRHVPVIAVTANAREEQIQTTLKSGIDDVVSKPFRVGELLPKMREVLARFDMSR
jgi:signal transduction histidine kinase